MADTILSRRLDIFDPKDQVQIAKDIDSAVFKRTFFAPLIGRNSNAVIKTSLASQAGINTVKLRDLLKGKGVKGNSDFDTNRDQLTYLSQDVYIDIFGNSIKSQDKRFHKYRDGYDFAEQASEALTEWNTDAFERQTFANLSNDFTNIACLKADGTLWSMPVASTNKAMCAQVTANDIPTVAGLRKAITRARLGIDQFGMGCPPLRPYKSVVVKREGIDIYQDVFIIVLDSFGIEGLKEDPEWKEMNQYAGVRGNENALFTGQVGVIDSSVVVDGGVWNDEGAGILSSADDHSWYMAQNMPTVDLADYAGTGNLTTSIGMILGATAAVMPMDDGVKLYVTPEDQGRKASVAIDRLLGLAKAKYIGISATEQKSIYHNKDLSVMGLIYARKA